MLNLIPLNSYMYKYYIFIISGFLFAAFSSQAAPNPFDLKFPISELGNCGSVTECKSYCDSPANIEVCVAFGEKQGLLTKEEVREAKQYVQSVRQKVESRTSRNDGGGIDKKKASEAIASDGGPGGCGSFEECSKFCSDSKNQETCFNYGEKHGLFAKEESQKIRKLMNKTGPGGCKGEECRSYCEDPAHHEACIAFARENGLITDDEAQRIEKFRSAKESVATFGGPGGCKGEEECRNFCSSPENSKTCIEFARNAGFLHEERAQEHLDKVEGFEQHFEEFRTHRQEGEYRHQGPPPAFQSGPGGCSSPEECIRFCSSPENRSACVQFGPKSGGTPPGGTFREGEPPRERPERPDRVMDSPADDIRPFYKEELESQRKSPSDYREYRDRPEMNYQRPGEPNRHPQPEQYRPEAPLSVPPQSFEPRVEQAPPPPPPAPAPEKSEPTSMINNSYLGATLRFISR